MAADENSLLARMNPFCLLGAVLLICMAAWFCAWLYRNTNDFKKSLRLFLPAAIALDCMFIFALQIDAVLAAGLDICGIAALALISNHYFYH
ncbi:hypothetical protein IMSAGC013_00106 [Lachnospiraceae bacterium]|nr:hypothetical protein IMSAGC013_00106 [Lachnospiraceae bacterium]